ncbi:MAG: hypothetical protein ACLGI3_06900 [Actinomycetes bacterium]
MTNDAFFPDPWLMGVVVIGGGVVFWWLATDIERDEGALAHLAARLGAVMCVLMGVGIVVVAARGT